MIRYSTFHFLFAGSLQLMMATYQRTEIDKTNREDVSSGKQANKQLPAQIILMVAKVKKNICSLMLSTTGVFSIPSNILPL